MYSTHCQQITHFLPAHTALHFICKWNEPYLPLPSQPQLVIIYWLQRDGRLSRPCVRSSPSWDSNLQLHDCKSRTLPHSHQHTQSVASSPQYGPPRYFLWTSAVAYICMKNPNRVNNIVIAAYFYTCYILTVIIFCAVSFMPFVVFVKLIVWNKACSGPQWTMEDWMWTGSQKVWVPRYCSGLHLSVYISAW